MSLYQFVPWSYSWETVRSFSSLWEFIHVFSTARVFAMSSGIVVRVVRLCGRLRKKLCRVLAFHHLTGGTEENCGKSHVSGISNRFSNPNSSMGGTNIDV
jgi:hypothetical protein